VYPVGYSRWVDDSIFRASGHRPVTGASADAAKGVEVRAEYVRKLGSGASGTAFPGPRVRSCRALLARDLPVARWRHRSGEGYALLTRVVEHQQLCRVDA
jgi:hypothetical protein